MNVIIGQTVTLDFTTHDPYTGQVSDADVLPLCDVFEDNTDVPMISPAVVKRLGHLGDYRLSFDVTLLNGFETGKSYNVIATATVSSVTAKSRIEDFALVNQLNTGAGVSI